MRLFLKFILFSITLILTVLVAILRLLCHMSTMVLGSISFLFFILGLTVMLLLQDYRSGLQIMILSFALGPFGLPFIVSFLVELIGLFNDSLKTV